MSEIENWNDQVEAYVDQTLSTEEHTAFEKELQSNEALQKEVDAYRLMIQAIREKNREETKQFLMEVELQNENKTIPIFQQTWFKVAAMLLLISSVSLITYIGVDNLSNTNQPDYLSYYSPYPNYLTNTTRGVSEKDSSQIALQKAMLLYELGDFPKAEGQLVALISTEPKINLYLGICYLEQKEYVQSLACFAQVSSKDDVFYEASQWYMSICLLQSGGSSKTLGIEQVKKIAKNKNHEFQKKANELMNEIGWK